MRSRFDEQLAELNRELIEMGALCEEAIALAAKSLSGSEDDGALAAKVAPLSAEIDRKERDIEAICLRLLLHQQPVARDLRQISAALKMITDMERIGDQAENIAEIAGFIGERGADECSQILDMAKETISMVTGSVDAYVKRDIGLAEAVLEHDDIVDRYFTDIRLSLISLISRSPEEGEYALDLLMVAKYFERIGDHATNIAEWVVFSITGEHKEILT